MTVVTLHRVGESFGEIGLHVIPDVVDGGGQAFLGEESHSVPGEPGERVLGGALKIRVDLVLERAVVDRVDLDLGPTVCCGEGVDHVLQAFLRHCVGLVAADRHGATLGGGAGRGGGGAPTGCDKSRQASVARNLEHISPGQLVVEGELLVEPREPEL